MRFLKSWIVALVMGAASLGVTMAPASAQSANNLSGVWQGVYWGEGATATTFQVTLYDTPGPGFTGSIVEVNNFGNLDAPFLLATVSGQSQGGIVNFTKTYDGTGDVSHSVTYTGTILSGGRRIAGSWDVDGAQGQFEIAR